MADRYLLDGELIEAEDWALETIWTPGHLHDHVCYGWSETEMLFSGDHIMGWSTTIISPPHGSITDFMASLRRLKSRDEKVFYPGHGDCVLDPQEMIRYQELHRIEREQQILYQLTKKASTAIELAEQIYVDLPTKLIPMAARNVLAHLLDLEQKGQVNSKYELNKKLIFYLR